jgi:hypothetical protein
VRSIKLWKEIAILNKNQNERVIGISKNIGFVTIVNKKTVSEAKYFPALLCYVNCPNFDFFCKSLERKKTNIQLWVIPEHLAMLPIHFWPYLMSLGRKFHAPKHMSDIQGFLNMSDIQGFLESVIRNI